MYMIKGRKQRQAGQSSPENLQNFFLLLLLIIIAKLTNMEQCSKGKEGHQGKMTS